MLDLCFYCTNILRGCCKRAHTLWTLHSVLYSVKLWRRAVPMQDLVLQPGPNECHGAAVHCIVADSHSLRCHGPFLLSCPHHETRAPSYSREGAKNLMALISTVLPLYYHFCSLCSFESRVKTLISQYTADNWRGKNCNNAFQLAVFIGDSVRSSSNFPSSSATTCKYDLCHTILLAVLYVSAARS